MGFVQNGALLTDAKCLKPPMDEVFRLKVYFCVEAA